MKKVVFNSNIDESYLKEANEIGLGFGEFSQIKRLKAKPLDIGESKLECRNMMKIMFMKLISKSLLKNKIIKGASAFAPSVMVKKSDNKMS